MRLRQTAITSGLALASSKVDTPLWPLSILLEPHFTFRKTRPHHWASLPGAVQEPRVSRPQTQTHPHRDTDTDTSELKIGQDGR